MLPPYNLVVSPTISVKDVDVLIVPPPASGSPLSDTVVRALSDYLDRGGHVLMIGDPLAAPLPAGLLQKYGLTEARGVVVEQSSQYLWGPSPVDVLQSSYPSFAITQDMNNVPTAFQAAEPFVTASTPITGFTTTPFLQSSSSAVYTVLTTTNGQQTLKQDPSGPQPPLNIGVAVEQTISSTNSFTNSTPSKTQTTRLVVIGDYDFVSDQLTSQAPGNLDLFYNTINWLSSSEERISVRPTDSTVRQLTMTVEQQNLIAWSTIVFLPALVLIGGGIVWWRRR